MIYAADGSNWETMADLAVKYKAALVVKGETLDELTDLTQKIQGKGVEDMVLDLGGANMAEWLARSTQVRRLALKSNFRPLGYPVIAFPGAAGDIGKESVHAAQAIAKYAGFIVLDSFTPELAYALLVLRENIYTDPQKPIQVKPGIYNVGDPTPDSPFMLTSNFSLTYFSVEGDVDKSKIPSRILVIDTEGLSVLTAFAAGKMEPDKMAAAIEGSGIADILSAKKVIIPGMISRASGKLADLTGFEIIVGPRESSGIPKFLREL
jgi:acetyl-CoA decarbonylase/synthase complex subunit gamma